MNGDLVFLDDSCFLELSKPLLKIVKPLIQDTSLEKLHGGQRYGEVEDSSKSKEKEDNGGSPILTR